MLFVRGTSINYSGPKMLAETMLVKILLARKSTIAAAGIREKKSLLTFEQHKCPRHCPTGTASHNANSLKYVKDRELDGHQLAPNLGSPTTRLVQLEIMGATFTPFED